MDNALKSTRNCQVGKTESLAWVAVRPGIAQVPALALCVGHYFIRLLSRHDGGAEQLDTLDPHMWQVVQLLLAQIQQRDAEIVSAR